MSEYICTGVAQKGFYPSTNTWTKFFCLIHFYK